MQRAICSEQRRRATRKAAGNVQHATDHRQGGKDNGRRATGNRQQGKRQQAPCCMPQTPRRKPQSKQPGTGNGQREAFNGQETADDMQEDARTCEMQRETHGTAAFRVRQAADKQQHARSVVLDNQCATRHRRHTQRCNIRPGPQHATNKHENTRGTTNEVRKLAHLGALSGSLRWTLGGGLTARLVRR